MTEPNEVPPDSTAFEGCAQPPSPAEAPPSPPDGKATAATTGSTGRESTEQPIAGPTADMPTADVPAEASTESPPQPAERAVPPPRPFWRAAGYTLAHLLSMGAVIFVLVGLAPRVENLCNRMQYDDHSALTTFVFEAGYFVRKNWYLMPLLLLFDLGLLLFLRRAFDRNLARHYTTIVVAAALLLTVFLGYGLIEPLTALYRRHF